MEQQEILEGNKLIAEFMDAKLNSFGSAYIMTNMEENPHYSIEKMQYHTSWDWLMPVVEKIDKSGAIAEISYSLVCVCRICVIGKKHEKAFNIINDNNGGLEPIIAVYKSVLEFIKWHNLNN